MKALVVEDDLSTRLLIKKIAENEEYEVLEAKDGYEGWSIFQKEKDDIYIALLDWMMPKMDGIELCRRIRKASVTHYIYILFLTSKRNIEAIVERIRSSICKKPFHAGNKKLDISASLGITSVIPAGNKKDMIHLLEAMIEKANSALYSAKNAGKNRVTVYGE